MKYVSSLLCLFIISTSWAKPSVNVRPTPSWVKPISIGPDTVTENGAYQYLLLDLQGDLEEEHLFSHYAFKIFNSEGVQSMSAIDATYDPTYQELFFHFIRIYREGEEIDKLNVKDFQLIQRETRMDRALYDGSLTAITNLTDVREGDIIEYAYSIVGFNPVNQGNFANTYYHQSTQPISRIFNRLLVPFGQSMRYRVFGDTKTPILSKQEGKQVYEWDIKGSTYKLYDNNTPLWYDPHNRISLSTFGNWKEVVDWALPLYTYDERRLTNVEISYPEGESQADSLLALIRWVQDDIRYLGFESGISGYKPNPPYKVFEQRYGDCKDKSLLLTALLRRKGLEAYPMLVHSTLGRQIEDDLPSPYAFNHCVVNFFYNGTEYFVDPTISNQGGALLTMTFPDYNKGLVIKPGQSELKTLPVSPESRTSIYELITVDSIGGGASFHIRSIYKGTEADNMRDFFSSNAKASIQKQYVDFYSSLYPGIESVIVPSYDDDNRNTTNELAVYEQYFIPDFWQEEAGSLTSYGEVYPIILASQIKYPKSAAREMPYDVGKPYLFEQTTELKMPEEWYVEANEYRAVGAGFSYYNSISGEDSIVYIRHEYEVTKEYISGDTVVDFLRKHDEIFDNLTYYVTYNRALGEAEGEGKFRLSWLMVVLSMTVLLGAIVGAKKLYQSYDPPSFPEAENRQIGGWLILPTIGLCLSPLAYLVTIFEGNYFNRYTWDVLADSIVEDTTLLSGVICLEIFVAILFLVFSVLVLILFFKRRTSVPRLVTILFLAGLIWPIMDSFLVEALFPGYLGEEAWEETYKNFFTDGIGVAIWVPYFNLAKRVKHTFCNRWQEGDSREDIEA
ncbi:MAG: DUF3857 domain-containing protein [Bacteroidota bacterium]